MRQNRSVVSCALIGMLFLGGCASTRQPIRYLSIYGLNSTPTVNAFDVCDSAGCRSITGQQFTSGEWQRIAAIFEPASDNAAIERDRINIAIGVFETIIGHKNGTIGDAPRNKRHLGTGKQLDCIAESANVTVALLLFKDEGLLQYHDVGYPKLRGFIRFQLPHSTASIIEIATGETYAVDSWFYQGGEPAVTVPLKEWKAGFTPED